MIQEIKKQIREVPNYPKEGVNFKDITTLLKQPYYFKHTVDLVTDEFKIKGITKVVCLESRGFIFGGAIAYNLNAGFVPARKQGKLPADIISEEYDLEYGTDVLEIHTDSLNEDDVVLIHDDLLATGGTALAALNLVKRLGVKKVYFSFISDLTFIQTESKKELLKYDIHTLLEY